MRAQTFKWLFLKTLKSADSPFWRSTVDMIIHMKGTGHINAKAYIQTAGRSVEHPVWTNGIVWCHSGSWLSEKLIQMPERLIHINSEKCVILVI